jgi:hypothetical protein
MPDLAPVPMLVMSDPRRLYVVCNECQRRSIPIAASGDGDAWLMLARLGWRCEPRGQGVVAVCRKCAARPAPIAKAVRRVTTRARKAKGRAARTR